MEKFKIMVVVIVGLISIYATNPDLIDVVLDGAIKTETVDFSISNNRMSAVEISYIVIQDNILVRIEGEKTLNIGEVLNIQVPNVNSEENTYELQVTEKSGSEAIKILRR